MMIELEPSFWNRSGRRNDQSARGHETDPTMVLSLLRFSEMTTELMTFNNLRCHSSSTTLGTKTGY